jgi:tetratricopeptide (TPR) repeat protein
LEAAEAVSADLKTTDTATFDLLTELVEQSLVVAAGGGDEDVVRYRMLEPIREYALEHLEQCGEAGDGRSRHAAYFLRLAQQTGPQWFRTDQVALLDQLAAEHENLGAAMAWLLEGGKLNEAVRFGWGLYRYWHIRGHLMEGERWMEQVLARGDTLPAADRALALHTMGLVLYDQGKHAAAASYFDASIALLRDGNDIKLLAHALTMRGYASLATGEQAHMVESFADALALHRQLGDRWGEGVTLNGQGYAALFAGDPDAAWQLMTDAEAALRDAGLPADLATSHDLRAMIAYRRGEYALAEDLLHESLELAAVFHDRRTVAYSLTWLAGTAAVQGQPERAARLWGAAEAQREAIGMVNHFSANRVLYEEQVATARTSLPGATFDALWEEGRAMTLEQAIAYALGGTT